jgi:hypothetical protein
MGLSENAIVSLLEINENGEFFCNADGIGKLLFSDSSGRHLTKITLPRGAWPAFLLRDEDRKYLYFNYFLSNVIHKWRLTDNGQRLHGEGIGADELQILRDRLTSSFPENQEILWILQKNSGKVDISNKQSTTQVNEFMSAEIGVLRWLASISDLETPERQLTSQKTQKFLKENLQSLEFSGAPEGYHENLSVRCGSSTFSAGILRKMLFEDGLEQIVNLPSKVLDPLYAVEHYTLAKFAISGLRELSCEHCVEIQTLSAENSGPIKTIGITLASGLVSQQIPAARREGILNRIRVSLRAVMPHLLNLFDSNVPKSEKPLRFCFSDNGHPNALSFDQALGHVSNLIPDLYMLNESDIQRYGREGTLEEFSYEYRAKKPILYWRGSTTGLPIATVDQATTNHRIASCIFLRKNLAEISDCRISQITQTPKEITQSLKDFLIDEDIFSEPVPESIFAKSQMYLDLPGNAASWGTFRKFALGCLVIRPKPTRELAYYRYLEPGSHFIEARSDLSDLKEIVEWAISNQATAAAIAYAGRTEIIRFMKNLEAYVQRPCIDWLAN